MGAAFFHIFPESELLLFHTFTALLQMQGLSAHGGFGPTTLLLAIERRMITARRSSDGSHHPFDVLEMQPSS